MRKHDNNIVSLGRFYTPDEYSKISTMMLNDAIQEAKDEGKDFVIVDRCAGIGNLEKQLPPDVLKKCILNTINKDEFKQLNEKYGDRVYLITKYDALTQQYTEYLKELLDKDFHNCAIIFLENPPYIESNGETGTKGTGNTWVQAQMTGLGLCKATKDLANQFIWSAYKYFKPFQCIFFAPCKYFKSQKLIQKDFKKGYLCNREKFGATEGTISLIRWGNKDEIKNKIYFKIADYIDDWNYASIDVECNKVENYIKNAFNGSDRDSKNELCWISSCSVYPDFKNGDLCSTKSEKTVGKYGMTYALTEHNWKKLLPIWIANCWESKSWYQSEFIMKNFRNYDYIDDEEFLNNCLFYSIFTNKNNLNFDSPFFDFALKNIKNNYHNALIFKFWNELQIMMNEKGMQFEYPAFKHFKSLKIKDPKIKEQIIKIQDYITGFYRVWIEHYLFKYGLLV